jgi:glycerol-3-phosphate acyltransferase PlsY
MLKTIIPLYLSFFILKYSALNTFSLENYGYLITSFGVLIGHCYPIFYSFQGGKAVSCFAGIIVATSWVLFIILIFSIFILSKKVSLASMITASSLALISYLLILCPHYVMNFHLVNNLSYALFLTIAALILIIRHKDNIVRLIKHQENKLDLTKK